MQESPYFNFASEPVIIVDPQQLTPFIVKKTPDRWQLSVNKTHLASKGFLPDEIDGAIFLEQEVLKQKVNIFTKDEAKGVGDWQKLGKDTIHADSFKIIFERIAALKSLEGSHPQRAKFARKYLDNLANKGHSHDLPTQLFACLLDMGMGRSAVIEDTSVESILNNLNKTEKIDNGREISTFDALTSPELSFKAKTQWFEKLFIPRLKFIELKERLRLQKVNAEIELQTYHETEEQFPRGPNLPPKVQDEYEQHRGNDRKGQRQVIFTIANGASGYWEEDSYDYIDEGTGRVSKSTELRDKKALSLTSTNVKQESEMIISGMSGFNLFSVPLIAGTGISPKRLESLVKNGVKVFHDLEGHTFLRYRRNQPFNLEVVNDFSPLNTINSSKDTKLGRHPIPDEIEEELSRIDHFYPDSLSKITAWRDAIMNSFTYPKDEEVALLYVFVDRHKSRISAMTEAQLLDCYLARELTIAGLKRLDISDTEWRAVTGYFVHSKENDGSVSLEAGNRHAWVKVRTKDNPDWIIIDSTPSGDPIFQDEDIMDTVDDSSLSELSKDDLKQIEETTKQNQQLNKKRKSSEDYVLEFAKEAGIDEGEAQRILNHLKTVDQLKDSYGRNIQALLRQEFDKIIDKYTIENHEPYGPVELSRGDELDDPVAALIDLKAGSMDPVGFSSKRIAEETEHYYSGWDLELVTDGSGSMASGFGRASYLVQRDMSYSLHTALHRFSNDAQKRQLRLVTPLKIRSSQYMFHGFHLSTIKTLSEDFTPQEMVSLWKQSGEGNIYGGSPAHLGLKAIYDNIPDDEKQLLLDKKLLKVVALLSDGGYDNSQQVLRYRKMLEDLNIVVAEFPITSNESLSLLPGMVALKVIESARVLMPGKIRK